ncbi:GNAT family N-acetyltransferase [Verrucomicrobium sp. BvORR034]|jgi:ribosomal-protein-alanine N-acetyltransferase|uniref:GNAT family N-acetyltransferase n=1 Tax=Verrucomicrobium sp. BvORR034 TaxID=1396418 RepID=UPI000679BAE0|nr:GNAT family N-acetyltransferase [Verrucomicrobium sp. BvORR034]
MEYFPYPHPLETERLVLRAMTEQDAPRFHEIFDGEPKVWEFDPGLPCKPEERRMWTLRHAMEPDMASGRSGLFGRSVVRKEDGLVIGAAGICPLTVPGGWEQEKPQAGATLEPTLFYQMGLEYWGNGYMTEACRRLLDFALNELRLPRVLCGTQRRNVHAVRLMERLGFLPARFPAPSNFWGREPVCGVITTEIWKSQGASVT